MVAGSGLTKSGFCRPANLSRSLLDDYLAGRKEPSFSQVRRIAESAGLELEVNIVKADPVLNARGVRLARVTDLAMKLPRKRSELEFPPFRTLLRDGN
jgi:predicted transcriptional regulator